MAHWSVNEILNAHSETESTFMVHTCFSLLTMNKEPCFFPIDVGQNIDNHDIQVLYQYKVTPVSVSYDICQINATLSEKNINIYFWWSSIARIESWKF